MRRHHLLEGWGFFCLCGRCQREESLDFSAEIEAILAGLGRLVAELDWEAIAASLCRGSCWQELPAQVPSTVEISPPGPKTQNALLIFGDRLNHI